MRSSTLVFLHVLAAAATMGGLLATATLAASAMRRLAGRTAVLAAVAAFLTAVLGEVTRARENIDARWFNVSSGIAYAAVLLPSIALAFLASIATTGRPWRAGRRCSQSWSQAWPFQWAFSWPRSPLNKSLTTGEVFPDETGIA